MVYPHKWVKWVAKTIGIIGGELNGMGISSWILEKGAFPTRLIGLSIWLIGLIGLIGLRISQYNLGPGALGYWDHMGSTSQVMKYDTQTQTGHLLEGKSLK